MQLAGVQVETGTCAKNLGAGPGGCVNKPQECFTENEPILRLFQLALPNADRVILGNMDSIESLPSGINWSSCESLCTALEIPYDQTTVGKLKILETAWMETEIAGFNRRHSK